MAYLNYAAIRQLVTYSDRVRSGVEIPSESQLSEWVDLQLNLADDHGFVAYVDSMKAHLNDKGRLKFPYSAVQQMGTAFARIPPSALVLILSQDPAAFADDPRNAIADEDLPLVLDALERWDMSGELIQLVAGEDGFDVAVLKTTEPTPAPEPVAEPLPEPRPEPLPSPLLEKYNLTNIAIASLVALGGGYLAVRSWRRRAHA